MHFVQKSVKIYDMKRLFLPIFVFLLLVGSTNLLGAYELEAIVGVDGFTFDPYKSWAYTEPGTEEEFTSFKFCLVNLIFRHNISETLNWSVNIERDNVLQNSITALFGAKTDYFNVKFGPFLGFIDDIAIPDAGIIGNLELYLPGIVFLSISGSSTLGSQYEFTSNTYRETAGIKLGFWMEGAIPSLSANIKFLSRHMDGFIVEDTLFKYLFSMDLFAKNQTISGSIDLGYQIYKKVYKKGGSEYCDELSSLLMGIGINWQVMRQLCIKAGFEIPFFVSAIDPMTNEQKPIFLSKIFVGAIYTIK